MVSTHEQSLVILFTMQSYKYYRVLYSHLQILPKYSTYNAEVGKMNNDKSPVTLPRNGSGVGPGGKLGGRLTPSTPTAISSPTNIIDSAMPTRPKSEIIASNIIIFGGFYKMLQKDKFNELKSSTRIRVSFNPTFHCTHMVLFHFTALCVWVWRVWPCCAVRVALRKISCFRGQTICKHRDFI